MWCFVDETHQVSVIMVIGGVDGCGPPNDLPMYIRKLLVTSPNMRWMKIKVIFYIAQTKMLETNITMGL